MRTYFCVFFILALQTSYPQWQTYYTQNNSNYMDVCVVNQNLIWACGSQGKVVRTTNGGINWIDVSVNLPQVYILHIFAVDGNNVWVTYGGSDSIYSSTVVVRA